MVARPGLQALESEITRRGGEDLAVWDLIRDGQKIREVMESFGFSRGMFYNWLKAGGKERKAAYEEALKDQAHALVEKAEEQLFNRRLDTAPTNAEANVANSRAKFLMWLAGKRNRADYGDDPLVAINQSSMSIGSLHLNALLDGGLTPLEEQEQIVEAEVLSIEAVVDAVDEFESDAALAAQLSGRV